ncbi:MAG: SsrA-binding protein [Legionellales bacterium]|nr:MAG: SsrA-binding protein [Legionellales bacterium]
MTNNIIINRKARHNYNIEKTFDAGIALLGWEVKSIRQGNMQIAESYVIVKNSELWLLGAHIKPINSICTHIAVDPTRTRKLLLHKKEINTLIGLVERKGYTLVPLRLHWIRGKVKLEFALGKGKKDVDKRASKKEKDWNRDKARILKAL